MKRTLSVILTLVMLVSSVAATCITAFAEQEQIEEAIATVAGYEIGKSTTEVTVTAPEGVNYRVEVLDWQVYNYATDAYETYTGVFEDGKLYKVRINFIPNEGFSLSGVVECWINDVWGLNMAFGSDILEAGYLVNYTQGIDSVVLTGAAQAEAGTELPFDGISIPEDAMYTLDHVEWSDPEWDGLPEGTKFEDGEAYYQFVYLKAKEGWTFAENVTASMDGKEPDNLYNDTTVLKVQFYYTLREQITSVEVTGLDKPVAGQAPDTTVTAKLDGMEVPATVTWYDYDGNQVTQFAEKGIYEVEIEVQVPKGYEVPWDVPFMLDGKAVSMGQGSTTIYGSKIFTLGYPMMEKLEFTVEGFEEGKSATDAKVTEKGCTVLQPMWGISEDGSLNGVEEFDGKFEKNKKYLLMAVVELPDGYVADDSTQVYLNGKLYPDSQIMLEGTYAVVCVLPLELKQPATPVTGDTVPVGALAAVTVLSAAALVALPVAYKRKEQ